MTPDPLDRRLAEATGALHRRAERGGVMRALIRGEATRTAYGMLLRNLLPAYEALEQALPCARGLSRLVGIGLERAPALIADLRTLHGPDWRARLPLLPAGRRYAHRVALAASSGPRGSACHLAAHAYVRYLGDLSGGQIMRRVLERSLGLGPAALHCHDFSSVGDPAAARRLVREALRQAAADAAGMDALVAEARVAFRLNIAVSEAVADATRPSLSGLAA